MSNQINYKKITYFIKFNCLSFTPQDKYRYFKLWFRSQSRCGFSLENMTRLPTEN